jgi:cytochrome c
MLRKFMLRFRRAAHRLLLPMLPALALAACGPRDANPGDGTQARADTGADLERGRRLIEQYQCGRCHRVPGVAAARGRLAVPLDAMGARSYIAGRIPNRQDTLTQWIVDPPSLVPGTAMPRLGVSPEEAHHMAAYLGSLR